MKMLGDIDQLPHWLYHFKHHDIDCRPEEIEFLKKEYPLVNLVSHNMNCVMSRSPLIWYPKDLVLDVVMGRILVYAQFDLNTFFQMAANVNIQLSLFIGKKVVKDSPERMLQMLRNPKEYGIKVKFSNGRALNLVSSLLLSVYAQLAGPTAILELIKTLDEIQQAVE